MLLFLDSNIICSNYYMTGPSFEVAKKVGTIVLGQIVVDEVCNKYKEDIEGQVTKVKNAIQDLNRLIPGAPITLNKIDSIKECEKYKDFLEMFIIENGMTVAESYPKAEHEVIVQRALQRRKPFKADGSTGYRDYLVWLTCLEAAKWYSSEEIHFISGNTRDFADSNDKAKLHPDLLADLAERNISANRFYYWNSLKSFIDNYAKQKLDIIEAKEVLIAEIEENETGFRLPIQEFVDTKVVGRSLSKFDVLVPGTDEVLKTLETDIDLHIEEASEIDNDSLLLNIAIDCVGVVTSIINNSDIKDIEEYELDVEIVDEHEDICTIETTLGLQVQLKAVYSKNQKAVTLVEIDDIGDYNCPYCPY